jgi:hypothetical protein
MRGASSFDDKGHGRKLIVLGNYVRNVNVIFWYSGHSYNWIVQIELVDFSLNGAFC